MSLPVHGLEATGIELGAGPVAILFLHDPADESASDFWGYWPDRFADRGYRTLALDLPDDDPALLRQIVTVATRYLTASGSSRVMIIAGAEACALCGDDLPDALVLIAPPPDLDSPTISSLTPKLIVGGSADREELAGLKRLARVSRGWTLLSTFALANDAASLLASSHSNQIESQIAGFLQEFRITHPPRDSRSGRQSPK